MTPGTIVLVGARADALYDLCEWIDGKVTYLDTRQAGVTLVYRPERESGRFWEQPSKSLWRSEFPRPVRCLYLGMTKKATGWYSPGEQGALDKEYDPPALIVDKYHHLLVVMALGKDGWYSKPFNCLPEDAVEVPV
jgi:hypothetical protein